MFEEVLEILTNVAQIPQCYSCHTSFVKTNVFIPSTSTLSPFFTSLPPQASSQSTFPHLPSTVFLHPLSLPLLFPLLHIFYPSFPLLLYALPLFPLLFLLLPFPPVLYVLPPFLFLFLLLIVPFSFPLPTFPLPFLFYTSSSFPSFPSSLSLSQSSSYTSIPPPREKNVTVEASPESIRRRGRDAMTQGIFTFRTMTSPGSIGLPAEGRGHAAVCLLRRGGGKQAPFSLTLCFSLLTRVVFQSASECTEE